MLPFEELDITKNIKMIEWLKTELLSGVSDLFKVMAAGGKEGVLDILCGIIMSSYLLGKRLGLNFTRIDSHMENKIRLNIDKGHEAEKWYGDLTELSQHIKVNRRKTDFSDPH
ncbi:MAG TPA: hypothetical protein GXZ31_07165 [Thermoanaerobacterales bacterium]|nr:hypothetical protein [Thermoanaerobacterales bacterium]